MEHYQHTIIPVGQIRPYDKNARTHSPDQIKQIEKSIHEFGFTNPVLVDEQNNLIAGHGRLEAATNIGMESVPAITITDLDEQKRRALILADNKLALNAGWDEEMLLSELQALPQEALELTGFSEKELLRIMRPDETFGGDDDEDDDEDDDRGPRKTDDEYAAFEVVLRYESKKRLILAINRVKADHQVVSTEEALMIMCDPYAGEVH